MDKETVKERLLDYAEMTERSIDAYLPERQCLQKNVILAARHSLTAGGKRIRPALVMEFCRVCGGEPETALPVACAIEMMHTFSLIHDDLPCMDNDDLRRGKPTNHKVFGECTATLAGDALQAAAFQTILSAPLPAEVVAAAALELSRAAGAEGMCGGQQLDMEGEQTTFTLDQVAHMNRLKTGCLLRAACVMGVLAAGVPQDDPRVAAAAAYAEAIGLAFQVRDDMLNRTATVAEMGKPVGNDLQSNKSTYVSLLGLEQCANVVLEKTEEAKEALQGHFAQTAFLDGLADYLAARTN